MQNVNIYGGILSIYFHNLNTSLQMFEKELEYGSLKSVGN